jgi:hypothetical protein
MTTAVLAPALAQDPQTELDRLRRTRAWFDRRFGELTTVQDLAVEDPA